MGKLAGALFVLSLLALSFISPALALGDEPEFDVVWLKNGNKLEGIVVSEDAKSVVFRRLTTGRKGQTVASATLTIPKSDVLRIDRMPSEAREAALEKSAAFGDRGKRLAADLKRIHVKPVDIAGHRGWQATGRHFEVRSTCTEDFAREVTHYLDEVFTAYRECFDIRRNADRKIKVILLANGEEYSALQRTLFGGTIENVAFYNTKDNYIAAYNLVQKEEMERIRKSILEREAEIRGHRSRVKDAEIYLKRAVKKAHQTIDREVARVERIINRAPRAKRPPLLRKLKAWKKDALKRLEEKKKELKAELKHIRESADEAIDESRKAIRGNLAIHRKRNQKMYEMLFHEGFHAFAANYLWQRNGKTGVPRWLDEGLASYYEMSAVEMGELIHGAPHPGFLAFLRASLDNSKFLPLGEIIGADPAKFFVEHKSDAERATLHYAESWAIVHYMTGRVSRASMETYVADVLAGMDNTRAFEKMTGEPMAKTSAAVRAHIEKLELTERR